MLRRIVTVSSLGWNVFGKRIYFNKYVENYHCSWNNARSGWTVRDTIKIHRTKFVEEEKFNRKVPGAFFIFPAFEPRNRIEKRSAKKFSNPAHFRATVQTKRPKLQKSLEEFFFRKFHPLQNWSFAFFLYLQRFRWYIRSKFTSQKKLIHFFLLNNRPLQFRNWKINYHQYFRFE